MDLLIPLLILAGLTCMVFYSCFMVSSEESRRESGNSKTIWKEN